MTDWIDFTQERADGKLYFRDDQKDELRKAVQREFERTGLSAEIEVNLRDLEIKDGEGPEQWANGFERIRVRALSKREALAYSRGQDTGQYLIEFFKYQERSAWGYHDRLDQVWCVLTLVEKIP